MITRLSASIIGLLAFAGGIVMGMLAGNPFETIILRSLACLAGGMIVGWFAGYVGELIVHENFQQLVDADSIEEVTEQASLEAELDGPADGVVEAAAVDEIVTEDGGGENRIEDDSRSGEQTFAARAARELLTHAE